MSDLHKDPLNPNTSEPVEDTDKLEETNSNEDIAEENDDFDDEDASERNGTIGAAAPGVAAAAPVSASAAKKTWPWIAIAVAAIVALVVVLVVENGGGGSSSEAVGELNGKEITKLELYDDMVKTQGETQIGQALDQYMTLKLIGDAAAKIGPVSDADVNAYIDEIKKENNFTTDEAFEQALASSNLTLDAFKEQVRPQIELRLIFNKQLAPTEDDLKAYYEKNKDSFGTPEQVRASHILLSTKEEAEAVLKQLKEGADFATLAKEKSIDPGSKDKGGDLDFFGKGVMNEQFENAAFALKKGEMSDVVESPNGFHIIKVTDRKEAVVPTYDEVKAEVKNKYLDEKINEGASDWITKEKKEAGYKNFLTKEDATTTPDSTPAASAPASPEASASANP